MPLFTKRPDVRKLASERNVEGLVAAMGHKDGRIRTQAAWELERLNDRSPVMARAFVAGLADENGSVREHSASALARFIGDEDRSSAGTQEDDELVTATRRAVPHLLHDTWDGARKEAASLAGWLRAPEAVERLIELLKDPVSEVRAKATWSLGMIGDARAVQPLIDFVASDTERHGWSGIDSLGMLGDPRAEAVLRSKLTVLDARFRLDAVRALERIGLPVPSFACSVCGVEIRSPFDMEMEPHDRAAAFILCRQHSGYRRPIEALMRQLASLMALAPVSLAVAVVKGEATGEKAAEALASTASSVGELVANEARDHILRWDANEVPTRASGFIVAGVESAVTLVTSTIADHVPDATDAAYAPAIMKAIRESGDRIVDAAMQSASSWAGPLSRPIPPPVPETR